MSSIYTHRKIAKCKENVNGDTLECGWYIAQAKEHYNRFDGPKLRVEGSFFDIFVMDSNLVEPTDKVNFLKERRAPPIYSVWIGSKVKDINLERFGYSRLGSRRTYDIYHLLFSAAGNPLHMGLRMIEFGHIGVACPVVVEAHPIALGPFCKDAPMEGCLQCRGVFDGLFQVNAEANLRSLLVPDRRDLPICVFE